jgi:hypothetical protein
MDKPKPISTIDLALSALGLLKSGALVFVMLLLEWSRKREAQARLEATAARNDLDVEKTTNAIEKQAMGKSSSDIVDGFLKRADEVLQPSGDRQDSESNR